VAGAKPLSRRAEDRLRRDAAAWFARLRGPDAARHEAGFQAWRDADPAHQAAYDRLTRRWDEAAVLAHAASDEPGGWRSSAYHRPRTTRASGWVLAALTGLALILSTAGLAGWSGWQGWMADLATPRRLETQVSEMRSVRLSDGTTVLLDTDTLVTARMEPDVRRLSVLRGRARFDVARDARRPFIVWVGDGSVSAQDAVFDVAVSLDRAVAVAPIRGLVDVATPGATRGSVLHLGPGQRAAFGQGADHARIEPAPAADALWPTGRLSFSATPLWAAVAQINRYSRQKIVLADPNLGLLGVSGVFKATATTDFATDVAAMFGLTLTRASNGDYLLGPGRAT
jgi:transmembrane sensor